MTTEQALKVLNSRIKDGQISREDLNTIEVLIAIATLKGNEKVILMDGKLGLTG
jgi:hypothetical protein